MSQDIDEFIKLLQNHDWFWHYAQNTADYRRGVVRWKLIQKMASKIDQKILDKIWDDYAPHGEKPPKGIDLSKFKDMYEGD